MMFKHEKIQLSHELLNYMCMFVSKAAQSYEIQFQTKILSSI